MINQYMSARVGGHNRNKLPEDEEQISQQVAGTVDGDTIPEEQL